MPGLNVPLILRIVEFDTATGLSTAQYIYSLESLADINARIPGTANDFTATQQGRNIGISAIVALSNREFLVIERDNRGVGIDDPAGAIPVGSKRIYKINLTGATDVSGVSLAGTNALPAGVVPVGKQLTLDVQAALVAAGLPIPEKMEGLTVGPQLSDGTFALLLGTDNDFSVTQTGSGAQFDVYTNGTQGPLGGDPMGRTLLPTYLYSFKTALPTFQPLQTEVPEPSALALFGAGAALGLLRRRRRRS